MKWHDGKPITLAPPQKTNGYHIFLSHVWRSGQDQVAGIKVALRSLVPSCSIFLDVDGKGAHQHVAAAGDVHLRDACARAFACLIRVLACQTQI